MERWLLGDPRMDDDVIIAVVTESIMPLLARPGSAERSTT